MENMIDKLIIAEKRCYFRKWRIANKEKLKLYNKNYWKKKAMQKLEDKGGTEK